MHCICSSSEDWATKVFSTLKSAIPVTFEPSVLDFREQYDLLFLLHSFPHYPSCSLSFIFLPLYLTYYLLINWKVALSLTHIHILSFFLLGLLVCLHWERSRLLILITHSLSNWPPYLGNYQNSTHHFSNQKCVHVTKLAYCLFFVFNTTAVKIINLSLPQVLLSGESTTFDVVFLARSLGAVEDTLHIHTSLGILDYKVCSDAHLLLCHRWSNLIVILCGFVFSHLISIM